MDEFHELRETLVIFADTLQETAQDEGQLTDTLIELNEQLGERIFLTALANGKLAGWYIHKDAPLYYAESREAFDLAKAITAYIKGFYLLSEANEHVGLFTYEERLEASRSVAERITKLTEGDDDE